MLLTAALSGCISTPPTSVRTGNYSTTTGLPSLISQANSTYTGFDDYYVLQFRPGTTCRDAPVLTEKLWPAVKANPALPHVMPPGCVLLTKQALGIDEAEIPNVEWKRYQQQLALAGQPIAATEPAAGALPVPDYYTNQFYDYCPVVGISYEQAVAFCRWRGRIITREFNAAAPDTLASGYTRFNLRLPTEAEWELAAVVARGVPYGTTCLELPVQVNPKAAAYLKKRAGSSLDVTRITADIKEYNRKKPLRSWINHQQPEPYFLRLTAPAYVYQGPPNDYGLYQLLGNAAEMVQERGVTKGGSYLDALAACTIAARGTYSGPSPTVGFRCVCEVSYPNRK